MPLHVSLMDFQALLCMEVTAGHSHASAVCMPCVSLRGYNTPTAVPATQTDLAGSSAPHAEFEVLSLGLQESCSSVPLCLSVTVTEHHRQSPVLMLWEARKSSVKVTASLCLGTHLVATSPRGKAGCVLASRRHKSEQSTLMS